MSQIKCAAFDIDGAGTVDAAFIGAFIPLEVVALFFFGREDGVGMRDEHDGIAAGAAMREKEMMAGAGNGTGNEFSGEAEWSEGLSGEPGDGINAGGIRGEAVDGDETTHEVERGGEM